MSIYKKEYGSTKYLVQNKILRKIISEENSKLNLGNLQQKLIRR